MLKLCNVIATLRCDAHSQLQPGGLSIYLLLMVSVNLTTSRWAIKVPYHRSASLFRMTRV